MQLICTFVFANAKNMFTHDMGEHSGLVVRASDSGGTGRGFDPHSGRRVISLGKIHLLPKSTGNTQEAMAPSGHD